MLDALQVRVDALLQTNRELAARVAQDATGCTDPVPAEAEDDMKRKKPAEDPPPHGMLFGELGEEPAETAAEDVQEELILAESDSVSAEVASGRKKRAGSAATKRDAAKTQPVVAETPAPAPTEDVPAWVSGDSFEEESGPPPEVIAEPVAVAEAVESKPPDVPAPRPGPVPVTPRAEPRIRKPHPFAVTSAAVACTEAGLNRPALVVPPASNGRRKHPFSDFASSAVQQSSVPSDVHWSFPAEHSENRRTETLRKQMEKAGLSRDEAADSLGVMRSSIDTWLSGSVPVPSWVFSSMRVLELLSPQARRNARARAAREQFDPLIRKSPGKEQRHPFAKIEEL